MSAVTDPRLDATKAFRYLAERRLCEAPCPCKNAAKSSSGQVHCPACESPVPTIGMSVSGSRLDLHCSAGCPDENVWAAVADLLADGDPPEVYRYVDSAVGGTNQRNRVRDVPSLDPMGRTDVFVSYQRATVGLQYYVELHRNRKDNASIEKYPGLLWTPLFPIDIDQDDLTISLEITRTIARRLEALGVPLDAVRFFFSGSKGFSIELPATLFGGFEPSTGLPSRLKQAAKLLLEGIEYDASIYSRLALWRAPNSRHGKSKLFKIPLTVREILTLSIDEMRELATCPRRVEEHPELTPIPDDEWLPAPELVDIWARAEHTVRDEGAPHERRRGTVTDKARDRQTVAAISASWPHDKKSDLPANEQRAAGTVSRHHDYLMPIIGFLALRTADEHVVELLAEAAEQAGDQDFLTVRDWRSEIERLGASSSERAQNGEKFVGFPRSVRSSRRSRPSWRRSGPVPRSSSPRTRRMPIRSPPEQTASRGRSRSPRKPTTACSAMPFGPSPRRPRPTRRRCSRT